MLDKVGIEVRYLSKCIGRYLTNIQINNDLTGPQGIILIYIYEHENENVYQKDIEKFLNIRRSSVTTLITSLEEKQYLNRVSVKDDGRLKKLVLTDKANNVINQIELQIQMLETKMIKDIDQKDINIFRKVIEKMTKNLMEVPTNE